MLEYNLLILERQCVDARMARKDLRIMKMGLKSIIQNHQATSTCILLLYKKVGVLPIRIVKSNVSSVGKRFSLKPTFLSDEGPTLETLDFTIRIGSTPTISYFDLYLYTAYAAHYVCIFINLFLHLWRQLLSFFSLEVWLLPTSRTFARKIRKTKNIVYSFSIFSMLHIL